ncbi:MAG: hypothetical protein ACYDC8_06305 [Gammaproteobacteria bacterium]
MSGTKTSVATLRTNASSDEFDDTKDENKKMGLENNFTFFIQGAGILKTVVYTQARYMVPNLGGVTMAAKKKSAKKKSAAKKKAAPKKKAAAKKAAPKKKTAKKKAAKKKK